MKRVLLALTLSAGAMCASAALVYDSSSAYAVGTLHPTATSGFNSNLVTHPTLAYAANSIIEAGGHIRLAGMERQGTSAVIQMRTGPNGSPAISNTMTFSLNFYSSLGGASIGSRTATLVTPAGSGTTNATFRPFYDVTFDLTGLTLQDEIFYGLSFNPQANVTAQSTNLSLWNYGTAPGFPTTDSDYDGATIKVGTDLSNSYWFKKTDNIDPARMLLKF